MCYRGCTSTDVKGRSTYRPLIRIPKNDKTLWAKSTKVRVSKTAGPKSVKPAGIPVVLLATGDVQLVEQELSTVGEPLPKRRKGVDLKTNSLEIEQENLVVMKENVRCYGRVRKPLVQRNKGDNVVPRK